jgi:hypothetical protein
MLDHVSITVIDIGAAERFYDAIMSALGVPKVRKSELRLGYGERCDGDHPDRNYLSISWRRNGRPPAQFLCPGAVWKKRRRRRHPACAARTEPSGGRSSRCFQRNGNPTGPGVRFSRLSGDPGSLWLAKFLSITAEKIQRLQRAGCSINSSASSGTRQALHGCRQHSGRYRLRSAPE